jgi:hypothetical protein
MGGDDAAIAAFIQNRGWQNDQATVTYVNSIIDVAKRTEPIHPTPTDGTKDEEEDQVPSSADWQEGLNFVAEKLDEKKIE